MLTFTTLASGSSGNAALVSCGDTHVLLDAGISARRITTGLKSLGVDPADLSAILITHEHQDHVSGLAVLTKKIRPPIYATPATCGQLADQLPHGAELLQSRLPGAGFAVGELWIEPFATPHDAAGSVGYVLSGGGRTMALCTDLGHVTDQVRQAVAGCDLLVCETNYDPDWMRTGPYPYVLKQRIMGDHGHLSNQDGAELAAMSVQSGASIVILAHLSAENNTPARALETVRRRLRAMGCDPEGDITLAVAPRTEVGPTYRLERRLAAAGEKGDSLC